ncbi:Uncharacterized protein TCM_023112 [Theobroma cacao]|uniref:Integrase catalytic domain-containing protein n=1 Tax=Theobroma cacao TaxID=3641 RepID=A0A061F209_THECC|nr:Uncharacterized protein TCM_023112 [Theobroma cacao]
MIRPFPTLDEAHNLVLREESQRSLHIQSQPLIEASAMATYGDNKKRNKNDLVCSHSEKKGHLKDKCFRSNNGLEFDLESFYSSKGVIHQNSCVGTPQQNGVVEKKHQTLLMAMQQELTALEENATWTIMPLFIGAHIVGCKWVYKLKLHANGTIEWYKARLVAKGYSQKEALAVSVGYLDEDLITIAHRRDTEVDAKPYRVSICIRGNECLSRRRGGCHGLDESFRGGEKTDIKALRGFGWHSGLSLSRRSVFVRCRWFRGLNWEHHSWLRPRENCPLSLPVGIFVLNKRLAKRAFVGLLVLLQKHEGTGNWELGPGQGFPVKVFCPPPFNLHLSHLLAI